MQQLYPDSIRLCVGVMKGPWRVISASQKITRNHCNAIKWHNLKNRKDILLNCQKGVDSLRKNTALPTLDVYHKNCDQFCAIKKKIHICNITDTVATQVFTPTSFFHGNIALAKVFLSQRFSPHRVWSMPKLSLNNIRTT